MDEKDCETSTFMLNTPKDMADHANFLSTPPASKSTRCATEKYNYDADDDDVPTSPLLQGASEHASAITQAIKDKTTEIVIMETRLKSLKEEKNADKQRHANVMAECQRVWGELCAIDSDNIKCQWNIKSLKKEIANTMMGKHLTELRKSSKENELERTKKIQAEYERKMGEFREKVSEMEAKTEVGITLSLVKQKASDHRARKEELEKTFHDLMTLPNGTVMTEVELQEEVRSLEQRQTFQTKILESKQQESQKYAQECERLVTANQILMNKNSAMLIRLNRKVDEQHTKHNDWKNHLEFLQKQIEITQEKLQKFEE